MSEPREEPSAATTAYRPTCGEAVVKLLADLGVQTVFGIPGVHTREYYRGFARTGIEAVLARHEQSAAYMADGYSRATDRPGVCCLITGPGVTNAATGIAQAYSDSVPLLVLSSGNRASSLGKGLGDLHELRDQLALAKELVGNAVRPLEVEAVPSAVRLLWESLTAARPRPAYLELPVDLLSQRVDGYWSPSRPTLSVPPRSTSSIALASEILTSAERPALILGGGARAAAPLVQDLVDRLPMPVFTTIAGRGVLAEAHPLAGGATLFHPAVQEWLESSDLLLVIGSELAESDTHRPALPCGGDIIRVDIDRDRFADSTGATLAVHADAGAFTRLLVDTLPMRSNSHASRAAGDVAALRKRLHSALTPLERRHQAVLAALRAALPDDGLVFSDMAQLAYTGNFLFEVRRPRQWFHPVGFGALGWALPAALGASVGKPGVPIVAVVGDAGLLLCLGELATVAELGPWLTILLWNNDSLGRIRDDMVQQDIPTVFTRATNPDFSGVAKAFGIRSAQPSCLDDLAAALSTAISSGGPALVELHGSGDFQG